MPNNVNYKTDISEDLKKELVEISYLTTLIHSDEKDMEQVKEDFTNNVNKYFSPDFQYVLHGNVTSREDYITFSCNAKILEVKYYNNTFTRCGDTVIVQGLFDSLFEFDGKTNQVSAEVYFDIFTKTDDGWLMLANYNYPKTDSE